MFRKNIILLTDLDGIWIVKNKEKYYKLTDTFFKNHNIDLKLVEKVDKKIFPKLAKAGRNGKLAYKQLIEKYFKAIDRKNYKKLTKEFINFEKSITKKYFKLQPLAKRILKELKELNLPIICVSDSVYSSKQLKEILSRLELAKFFDKIYTSNHLKCEKPRAFSVLKSKLNLQNKIVIFIGHDNDEIKGAKKYGFITIGLNNKEAHFIASNLKDIPQLINNYRKIEVKR